MNVIFVFFDQMRAESVSCYGHPVVRMPNFDLTDEELDNLIDFLKWTSEIKDQGWPPTEAG